MSRRAPWAHSAAPLSPNKSYTHLITEQAQGLHTRLHRHPLARTAGPRSSSQFNGVRSVVRGGAAGGGGQVLRCELAGLQLWGCCLQCLWEGAHWARLGRVACFRACCAVKALCRAGGSTLAGGLLCHALPSEPPGVRRVDARHATYAPSWQAYFNQDTAALRQLLAPDAVLHAGERMVQTATARPPRRQ